MPLRDYMGIWSALLSLFLGFLFTVQPLVLPPDPRDARAHLPLQTLRADIYLSNAASYLSSSPTE